VRIPHSRLTGPLSSSNPRSASPEQTRSVSSTQIVNTKRDPPSRPATAAGPIRPCAALHLEQVDEEIVKFENDGVPVFEVHRQAEHIAVERLGALELLDEQRDGADTFQ
jgi:hypothetical protein